MHWSGEIMYVDIVLIGNFIIDFFLLKVVSRFSKLKTSGLKLAIGAAVGALYVMVAFLPPLKMFFTTAIKIAVSILMVIIAFTPEKFRDFFKVLSIFYIITFAFGGAAFAVFFIAGYGSIKNGIYFINDFPFSILIISFALGYLLLNYCWNYVQDKVLSEKLIYNVLIQVNEKKVVTNAKLDTGNSLKEPISNLPVIVVEYDVFKDILPEAVLDVFGSGGSDDDFRKLYDDLYNSEWVTRMRLIPFTSLGKQNGMLVGIKPDLVKLDNRKFNREVKDVIIGLYKNKLSRDGEYQALLYPEILK